MNRKHDKSSSPAILPKDSEKILVIMVDYHLGDFAVSLPVIEQFAKYFDNGIDVAVTSAHSNILKMLPSADKIRIVEYKEQKKRRDLVQWIRYVKYVITLVSKRYKTVINISYRHKCAMFSLFTLAKTRIGLSMAKRSWCYTEKVESMTGRHKLDLYSSCLKKIGINKKADPVSLNIPQKSINKADDIISGFQNGNFALFHATAGQIYRCWPKERFAEIAKFLIKKYDMDICLIGTPNENKQLSVIKELISTKGRVHIINETLDVAMALMEKCSLFLSNLSGPTFLATMITDAPTITIVGPTIKERWTPLGKGQIHTLGGADCASNCAKNLCKNDMKCVHSVSAEDVKSTIDNEMLAPLLSA